MDYFQIPMPSRFPLKTAETLEVIEDDSVSIVEEIKELKKHRAFVDPLGNANISSVVLEHWEDGILWDETDLKRANEEIQARPSQMYNHML